VPDLAGDPLAILIRREADASDLAATVAQEKAEAIHEQRPAIQALGVSALRALVLRIFDALAEGHYEDSMLADAFGLSKATFSRFAGSRWQAGDNARVPDLWLNVARTLSAHTAFGEAAQRAGVWARVEEVLRRSPSSRTRRHADG